MKAQWILAGVLAGSAAALADPGAASALVDFEMVGDAVPAPLNGLHGNAARGKAVVLDRRTGNCLICHTFPVAGEPFQGAIGPPLAGVGSRLTEGRIRARLIDQSRINPDTLMPPYYRVSDLTDVAPEFRGQPALTAQQIEDVVAYLVTLGEPS
jgi:sulfur-oxidizing protein SoxX